jgi:hypothetical protein
MWAKGAPNDAACHSGLILSSAPVVKMALKAAQKQIAARAEARASVVAPRVVKGSRSVRMAVQARAFNAVQAPLAVRRVCGSASRRSNMVIGDTAWELQRRDCILVCRNTVDPSDLAECACSRHHGSNACMGKAELPQ